VLSEDSMMPVLLSQSNGRIYTAEYSYFDIQHVNWKYGQTNLSVTTNFHLDMNQKTTNQNIENYVPHVSLRQNKQKIHHNQIFCSIALMNSDLKLGRNCFLDPQT
jgi:methyl coenzyme M reductase alpha subunit